MRFCVAAWKLLVTSVDGLFGIHNYAMVVVMLTCDARSSKNSRYQNSRRISMYANRK